MRRWIPQQHGAWAMLIVPDVVGLMLAARVRPLTLADVAIAATWIIGYFAFNALSLTLKSSPKRRLAYQSPLRVYLVLACISGVFALIGFGPALLWWIPVYVLLLGPTLWLVAHKKERSLASGVLTVLASCGLMPITYFTLPIPTLDPKAIWVMVAITSYFLGTIVHVKALIRERNTPAALARSIAFHLVFAGFTLVGAVLGQLLWTWALWGVAALARAIWLPAYASRNPLAPRVIGLIEVAFSVAAIAFAALG